MQVYAVNEDCSQWYPTLKQCKDELFKGYLGNTDTIVYKLTEKQYDNGEESELSYDDEVGEFINGKWRSL